MATSVYNKLYVIAPKVIDTQVLFLITYLLTKAQLTG